MHNKNKLLIIDGNNLLHRAYHQFKRMASKEGVPSSVAFGFPHILKSLIHVQKPSEVLVAFDGGRDKHRLKAWPDYKKRGERADFDYDDFISQKEDVQKILSCLGIPYVSKKGLEADDIIWLYTRKFKKKGNVVIVSTDKDFNQLVSAQVSIWHPWKNKRITHKNMESLYGYTPEQCVDYLSLCGDSSDNIPGKKGIGHKTAIKFIAEYGSLKEYVEGKGEEYKKMSREEAKEIYERNRLLIDIRLFCRKHIKFKDIPLKSKKGKRINKRELAIICSKYSITKFTSIDFLKTYKNLL